MLKSLLLLEVDVDDVVRLVELEEDPIVVVVIVVGLWGDLSLLVIFLLLIGMLSIPSTSSKLAPMLESNSSAVSLCSTGSALGFTFAILAFGDSSSCVRCGLRDRLDDLVDVEEDFCLSDFSLATFCSLCCDLSCSIIKMSM